MSRDPEVVQPALVDWLARPLVGRPHDPAPGWEPDPPPAGRHCCPELVARLAEIARPIAGVRRRFVAGCP